MCVCCVCCEELVEKMDDAAVVETEGILTHTLHESESDEEESDEEEEEEEEEFDEDMVKSSASCEILLVFLGFRGH